MSANMVDWGMATALGARLAGDGPAATPDEMAQVVAELRDGAMRSTGLVAEHTGLVAPADTAPLLVVDRATWVRANAASFRTVIEPVATRMVAAKGEPSGMAQAVGSRVTGAEIGLLLGFLGGKVLGQFDPFFEPAGRLLLVAPNIVHVEREIGADTSDFRLWVCLHEETHRVQFTAVPWMREHLFAEVAALVETVEPTQMAEDLLQRLPGVVRGEGSIIEVMSTPEQREIIDRVTGMMSLLEGHADVVMDGVGPSVIPSVAEIRAKFNRRRQGVGALDRVLRRLLGLDAKMAQYRNGAAFVRGVVAKVGMPEFNAVWAEPGNLPSKDEIADPVSWVVRVLG